MPGLHPPGGPSTDAAYAVMIVERYYQDFLAASATLTFYAPGQSHLGIHRHPTHLYPAIGQQGTESCGISYGSWQSLDCPKLASLGTEGRSSATTVLSLTAIRYLREDASLHARAANF
jgi:hypothetical protein